MPTVPVTAHQYNDAMVHTALVAAARIHRNPGNGRSEGGGRYRDSGSGGIGLRNPATRAGI
jgi:hypothetical protein